MKSTVSWWGWEPAAATGTPPSSIAGTWKPGRKPKGTASIETGVVVLAAAAWEPLPKNSALMVTWDPEGAVTSTSRWTSHWRPGSSGSELSQLRWVVVNVQSGSAAPGWVIPT